MTRHIAIATPCYGNTVFTNYLTSMLRMMIAWKSDAFRDTHFSFLIRGGDSLIPRVRNSIVAEFLSKDIYTHLLWIDADIGFTPEDVLRLADSNHDVACGIYPLKKINFPDHIPGPMSQEEFKVLYTSYPFNPIARTFNSPANGFVEVLDAPTGLMMVKREVLTKMMVQYPELKYKPDTMLGLEGIADQIDNFYYRFFDVMVDDAGRYLSEDYAFCRRWQAMGGKVYADMHSKLTHQGQYMYEGNVLKTLVARTKQLNDQQAAEAAAAEAAAQAAQASATESQEAPVSDVPVADATEPVAVAGQTP